jgi:type I restriction enzyme R subunit
LAYYSNIDEILIEWLSQNQDFFSLLLNNDDIKQKVLWIFAKEIYNKLNEKKEN